MNDRFGRTARQFANHAGLLITGLVLAGCGPEAQSPAPEPGVEVRGEPIRGEPIGQAPLPAPEVAGESPKPPDAAPEPEAAVSVIVPVAFEPTGVPVAAAGDAGGVGGTPAGSAGESRPVETAQEALTSTTTPTVPADAAGGTGEKAESTADGGKPTGTALNPLSVAFEKLASFAYALPEGPVGTNTVTDVVAANQIPESIRWLNDQFISLKGFMLPLKVEKGLVTELLIMRDQSMCCYGTVPKINEWVSVKMVGEGVKPVMDQAVTLFGKLKVGEMYENGYLVGIFALDGERMAGPLDL